MKVLEPSMHRNTLVIINIKRTVKSSLNASKKKINYFYNPNKYYLHLHSVVCVRKCGKDKNYKYYKLQNGSQDLKQEEFVIHNVYYFIP